MEGDLGWEFLHNEYYRNDDAPISPITIFPSISSHTVEILITASDIPETWFYAGRLYYLLDDPIISPFPKIGRIVTIPVNQAMVIVFDELVENYWLRYHPFRWFLWQSVRVRYFATPIPAPVPDPLPTPAPVPTSSPSENAPGRNK